jgi:hypothetical protein
MVSARRLQRIFAALTISLTASLFGEAGRAEPFLAGGFSFSDELGGFRILSVSGTGSSIDPVILEEEIHDTGPVVLVIRRIIPDGVTVDRRFTETSRALTLIKVVRNGTQRIWAGFDLELQEVLDKPSIYSDGLSFNQIGASPPDVASDNFSRNVRLFEPYDRVRFHSGHVNPETEARIKVHITDPTPERIFYLLQDPQILFAFLMR